MNLRRHALLDSYYTLAHNSRYALTFYTVFAVSFAAISDYLLDLGLSFNALVIGAAVLILPTNWAFYLLVRGVVETPVRPDVQKNFGQQRILFAKYLLHVVPKIYRDYLLGDLEEMFQTVVAPEYGRFFALLWYWWQVVASASMILWEGLLHLLREGKQQQSHGLHKYLSRRSWGSPWARLKSLMIPWFMWGNRTE